MRENAFQAILMHTVMKTGMSYLLAALALLTLQECLGLLQNAVPRLPVEHFLHRVEMDQMGAYVMLWTPREHDIVIEVQVRTKGYVGLGFSPTGAMNGADIVIGWVDRRGLVHFSDRHASGNRTPVEDSSQDYELLGGYSNDTHTVLRFSRPWFTCDEENDFQITEDTIRVIWAYDALRPDPLQMNLNYHDHRGTRSLYLKEQKMTAPMKHFMGRKWDIRIPQVELPSHLNTLYWCNLYKIPDLPSKHHMIGYVPLIDEASLPHVHHMLLYECHIENSDHHLGKWMNEKGAQCYTRNMPVSWSSCGTAIVAWAIGSQGEMFPEHVGFPLGDRNGGATYFLLEIHYDNPQYKKGIVDNSGLRIFLTDKLRKYEAGVLTVGHTVAPTMIIPPRVEWKTSAHCTAGCTEKKIPPSGIRVFSGILHAHLLGRKIGLQQIRNGKELQPLISDSHYDFNYQQARFFSEEKTILPGDHLIATCVYNSSDRQHASFGGFTTRDEMCLVFLSYYPRIDLGECSSRPDLALLFNVFGIENLYENDRIMRAFSHWNFDESHVDELKELNQLKKMADVKRPGLDARKINLVDFFRNVNISEPARLRGKTFFDILHDESTWNDRDLMERLRVAVSNRQYEPSCSSNGRKLDLELPKKAKIPRYAKYVSKQPECQSASNRTRGFQPELPMSDDPSVREESKFIREKFTGINRRNQQQSTLSRNSERSVAATPSTTWTLLLFPVIQCFKLII